MKSYARIKSFNERLKQLEAKQARLKAPGLALILNRDKSFTIGKKHYPYGTFKGRCLTPCHNYSSTKIGSLACQGCGYFIKLDKEKQIVVCGYPVEEPENPTWCKHPVECPIETRAEKNKAWCACNCSSYKQPETKTVIIPEDEIQQVGNSTRTLGLYGQRWEKIKSIEMKVEI